MTACDECTKHPYVGKGWLTRRRREGNWKGREGN